ncbi:flavin reductase family protein [Agrobacterium tumefaciens]|nr:flavin reductase family protein [Agrobacterium tumefaciens]
MGTHVSPVPLDKAVRLINHGPTVLVSARSDGVDDVMAASWVCPLDFSPPKLTVVLDSHTKTRSLIERTGYFGIQVPNVRQLDLTYALGSKSLKNEPDKLSEAGVELFEIEGFDAPFVAGCSGWLACKVIPEQRNQNSYDLFIAEVIGAWADDRIFRDGHWQFESSPPEWQSLHYVAGGHFYAVGRVLEGRQTR